MDREPRAGSSRYIPPSTLCIPSNPWSIFRSSNRARRSVPLPVGSFSYPVRICVICGQSRSKGSDARSSTPCIPCTPWSILRSSNRSRRSVPLPVGSFSYPVRICDICGQSGSKGSVAVCFAIPRNRRSNFQESAAEVSPHVAILRRADLDGRPAPLPRRLTRYDPAGHRTLHADPAAHA